jgi:hypothetical protein
MTEHELFELVSLEMRPEFRQRMRDVMAVDEHDHDHDDVAATSAGHVLELRLDAPTEVQPGDRRLAAIWLGVAAAVITMTLVGVAQLQSGGPAGTPLVDSVPSIATAPPVSETSNPVPPTTGTQPDVTEPALQPSTCAGANELGRTSFGSDTVVIAETDDLSTMCVGHVPVDVVLPMRAAGAPQLRNSGTATPRSRFFTFALPPGFPDDVEVLDAAGTPLVTYRSGSGDFVIVLYGEIDPTTTPTARIETTWTFTDGAGTLISEVSVLAPPLDASAAEGDTP